MNLLRDAWIPVSVLRQRRRISLSDVLCTEESCGEIFHPRDDMELAAVQMCICLVQSIFPLEDEKGLRARNKTPMSHEEYQELTEPFVHLFSVDDAKLPFMQDTRATAKKSTPVQKLLVGLPGGDSSTMFVAPDEISKICPSCAAIALFNMTNGIPLSGRGYKITLRGNAPISVFVSDENLRNMIWQNIIPKNSDWYKSLSGREESPVWEKRIVEKDSISAARIGLMRGLFWQPASILLKWQNEEGICDCCGLNYDRFCYEFSARPLRYDLSGLWHHPHNPYRMSKKKQPYMPSFGEQTPAWAHLSEILPECRDGESPPAVILNYSKAFLLSSDISNVGQKIALSIGVYINEKASILERHHHRLPLAQSLLSDEKGEKGLKKLRLLVDTALEIQSCLRKSVFSFFNKMKKPDYGFASKSEKMFFQRSEEIIMQALVSYSDETLGKICSELRPICEDILEEIIRPWLSNIKSVRSAVSSKHYLSSRLLKIQSRFKEEG